MPTGSALLQRRAVSPLVSALLFVLGTSAATAQAPAIDWRRSDWLEELPGEGGYLTREGGGGDWWFHHVNAYNSGLDGYVAAGYGGSINWVPSEEIFGGCYRSTSHAASCAAFETEGHVTGPSLSSLALINPDGDDIAWFESYNIGALFRVIQTRDGGFLAAGVTDSTRDFKGDPIYYNPGRVAGRTQDSFGHGQGCTLEGNDIPHAVLVKTDRNGKVEWQYLYGMIPYLDENGQPAPEAAYSAWAFPWALIETTAGNFILGGAAQGTGTFFCGADKRLFSAFLIEVTKQGQWASGTFLGPSDVPSEVEAITRYGSGEDLRYVISGHEWFPSTEDNGYTGCNLYQKVFAAQLRPEIQGGIPAWKQDWKATDFDLTPNRSQRTDDVQISRRNSVDEILLPLIVDCVNCRFGGLNTGRVKVYRLAAADGQVIGAPADLGARLAFDLKVRVVPTEDGGFAAATTAQDHPPSEPSVCEGIERDTRAWNTDAYVAKFDASMGLEWEKVFDVDGAPATPFPGDPRKQECLFAITRATDGGFVVSGHNSFNFDDSYVAKLGPAPVTPPADLLVRDTPQDTGEEPNPDPGPMWVSQDIWVRNEDDTGLEHQDPIYREGGVNYVRVRVTNRGNAPASGWLNVYWAKASTGLEWPRQWVGYRPGGPGTTLYGDPLGDPVQITGLAPHSSIIIHLEWMVPNPADFASFLEGRTHFCLLARIETEPDSPFGMTFEEGGSVTNNTRNNNNVAWKNLNVIEGGMREGFVTVRNVAHRKASIRLAFAAVRTKERLLRTFLDYGAVEISLGHELFTRWSEGGRVGAGVQVLDRERLAILSPTAWIGNLQLAPDEGHVVGAKFKLTRLPGSPLDFHFDLAQYTSDGGVENLVGGERFSMSSAGLALPDLTILATANTAVLAGRLLEYSLVVANAGTTPAVGAIVSDVLPPSLSAAAWTCVAAGGGVCGTAGVGNLHDSIDLPPGASATYTLTATVAPTFFGPLSNTATVSMPAGQLEDELENNVSVATTEVLPLSQIAATMTVAGSVPPGGIAVYTIVVNNVGIVAQLDNPGPELVDVLPSQLTLVGASATSGTVTVDPATGTASWNGALPGGAFVTITLQAKVAESVGLGETIQNQGTVHYDSDGNGTNDASLLTDDPNTAGAANPTAFAVPGIAEVPALSPWGILLLVVALSALGLRRLASRREPRG